MEAKYNISYQPSAVSYQHSAVSYQLSAFSINLYLKLLSSMTPCVSIQLSAISYQLLNNTSKHSFNLCYVS
ncbi:hypothetical protein [Moorena sp. SIO2C4]|uniref:hypothetical protein n=1 Tax=Moorena sp. SIO2C4 TaxID=2607824 RepID=UPI0013CB2881|nr:hypothetical protein [Moorena sp. SIO2C4]NES44174.1 hypothetical protein [Moorena sp. SIO2C4]